MSECTFKLVLLGESGVGKTTLVKKIKTDVFETEHVPTNGVDVYPIDVMTEFGTIKLDCWDTAGNHKILGLEKGCYIQADAAIIIFDITNSDPYKEIYKWVKSFRNICPKKPIFVCASKSDKVNSDFFLSGSLEKSDIDSYFLVSDGMGIGSMSNDVLKQLISQQVTFPEREPFFYRKISNKRNEMNYNPFLDAALKILSDKNADNRVKRLQL
jgi:small GTP-binding protein